MISLETLSKTNALPMPLVNFQGQPLRLVVITTDRLAFPYEWDGAEYRFNGNTLTTHLFRAGFQLDETLRLNSIETDFDRWVDDDFSSQQQRIQAARAAWSTAIARGDPNDIVNIVTHLGQPMPQVSANGMPLDVVSVSRKWHRVDKYEWNGKAYCLVMPKRTTGIKLTWGEFYAGFKKE